MARPRSATPKDTLLQVRVSGSVAARLKAIAERRLETPSTIYREALMQYLAKYDQQVAQVRAQFLAESQAAQQISSDPAAVEAVAAADRAAAVAPGSQSSAPKPPAAEPNADAPLPVPAAPPES